MRRATTIFLALVFTPFAYAERPDLRGTIYGPDDRPLSGATVQIYTAAVKEGTSPYCPSCYADCGKRATTNEAGEFTIPSLNPELLFKVLVVADGYTPAFFVDVDPAAGPVAGNLQPVPEERLTPEHTIRGRVLDPLGQPVVGATIEPYSIQIEGGTRYGGLDGIDPMTISDANGEFIITSEQQNPVLSVLVTARGLAPKRVLRLAAGEDVHDVHLFYGATLRGRLMHDDQPVPNAVVGIVTSDRAVDRFYTEYTIGTNEDGYFEFSNLPPDREFYVYAKRQSVANLGASQIRPATSGGENTTADIGTLELVAGHRVAGRVVLSDGAPVPAKTRLMWSRDDMWDAFFYELGSDGRFEMEHVLPGMYHVSIRVPDYRISAKNYSMDPWSRRRLIGVVDADIEDLFILLEPGDGRRGVMRTPDPEVWDQVKKLETQRIRGVDAADVPLDPSSR